MNLDLGIPQLDQSTHPSINNIPLMRKEFRSRYTTVRSRFTSVHKETFISWYTATAQNLDQSIPLLNCLDQSRPLLNCLDHSIPFRSWYTVSTVWLLDLSYSL